MFKNDKESSWTVYQTHIDLQKEKLKYKFRNLFNEFR